MACAGGARGLGAAPQGRAAGEPFPPGRGGSRCPPASRPGYETAGEGPVAARRPRPRRGSGGRRSAGESGAALPAQAAGEPGRAGAGPGAWRAAARRGGPAGPGEARRRGVGAIWGSLRRACRAIFITSVTAIHEL